MEFSFEGRAAEVAGDDIALRVDKDSGGDRRDAIQFSASGRPAAEVADMVRPDEAIVGDSLKPSLAVVVERDAEDLEAPVVVLIIKADDVGVFHTAGAAPGGPEIEEDDMAAEVAEAAWLTVGAIEDDIWGGVASRESGKRRDFVVEVADKVVGGVDRDKSIAHLAVEGSVVGDIVIEKGDEEGSHKIVSIVGEKTSHIVGKGRLAGGVEGSLEEEVVEATIERHIVGAQSLGNLEEIDGRHIGERQGDLLAREEQEMNGKRLGVDTIGVGEELKDAEVGLVDLTLQRESTLVGENDGVGRHQFARYDIRDDQPAAWRTALERTFDRSRLSEEENRSTQESRKTQSDSKKRETKIGHIRYY